MTTPPFEGRDGLVLGMSEDEYHGAGEFKQFATAEFSSSAAKEILKTPLDYKHVYLDGHRERKKAWDIGTATHSKVLGVGAQAVAYPEKVLSAAGAANTGDARKWRAEQEAAGNIVVKQGELDAVNAMTDAVLAHPLAAALLEQPGNPEASMFSTDPDTELRLRLRFDYMPDDLIAAVDLKTTRGALPRDYMKHSHDLGYHVSRAHYLHAAKLAGYPVQEMFFVAVQNTGPYHVVVYRLDPESVERGERKAKEARELLLKCQTTGKWPGYSDELVILGAPPYAMYQDETDR